MILEYSAAMTDVFLSQYFPRLPRQIILEILQFLGTSNLDDVFLHHPDENVSDTAFITYFSTSCLLLIRRGSPADIVKCFNFLKTHRNKFMRKLHLLLESDVPAIDQLKDLINGLQIMDTRVQFLAQFSDLTTPQDRRLQSLLAISSLTELSILGLLLAGELPLSSCPQLRHCSIINCEVKDWLLVTWPQDLKYLCITETEVDYSALRLPPLVETLKLMECPDELFRMLARYKHANGPNAVLKTLILTPFSSDTTMPLESLPESLVELVLQNSSFRISGISFPPMLKRLDLATAFCDWILPRFTPISLPPTLEHFTIRENLNSSTFLVPNFLWSLPSSLKTLCVRDCAEPLVAFGDPPIELPENLEVLEFSTCPLILLNQMLLPVSLQELTLEDCDIDEIEDYDDTTLEDGPKWSQLVNLKKLTIRLDMASYLAYWRPPPNLRELNLRDTCILLKFPPELDSLHTLETAIDHEFLLGELQLPRNLKVWNCFIEAQSFEVPILVCTHQNLQIWRLNGCCHIQFPPNIRGNLVLQIVDLLCMTICIRDREGVVDLPHQTAEEADDFYKEFERVSGRVFTVRPKGLKRIHYLCSRG